MYDHKNQDLKRKMETSEAHFKVLSHRSRERPKKTMKHTHTHTSIAQECANYNPWAETFQFSDYTFSYSRIIKKRKRCTYADANNGACSVHIFCFICLYMGSESQIYPIQECNPGKIIENLG